MSITVTVTPPSVVPSITSGAVVTVAAGAAGVGKTTVGAALRLSVANIDDPSTELAALGDSTWPAGTIAICTQDVAGANAYRVYVLDLASSTAQSTPNRIDRAAGGQWILEGGKGVAGSFTVETTLAVGGAATVGGTLGVTGAATFSSTLSAGASTLASATITGAATVGTTLGVTGATTLSSTLGVAGVASFTSGTASSSSSTGAVVITGSGGLGVGGAVNATGAIGSASTVTGTQLVSTVATGTAPLTVASTTVVTNLNASLLIGGTWAIPGSIGATTPAAGAFTTLSATGTTTLVAVNASGNVTISNASLPTLTINNTTTAASSWALKHLANGDLQIIQPSQNNWITLSHSSGTITSLGPVVISDGTESTSSSNGSFKTSGGGAFAKRLNVGGIIQSNSNIRTFGGSLIADFGSGGSIGGAASTIESNANIVLWSSNYYYDGANDARARAGGSSRLRMDITTGGTAGDMVFQCAATGAADSAISYANVMTLKASSRVLIATTSDDGVNALQVNGSIAISSATMLKTSTSFTNGAAAAAGTLTNAPTAGNPTKWIPINDNGTTRYIPAW